MLDTRRPAIVTDSFRDRLARELGPLGFAARKKALVRKVGPTWHRVELSSSHGNVPGDVTAWVTLVVTDPRIARVEPRWRAGGSLGGPEFADDPPSNVADPTQARELVERIRRRLAFFDAVQDPGSVHQAACRRYVPGMVAPRVVVPYLLAHLGAGAVKSYARALLRGRPELWPAFAGAGQQVARRSGLPDHGTQLAQQLTKHSITLADPPPTDTVVSTDPAAASLRCFFGLQLRAWGEVDTASYLRRLPDERIHVLWAEQERLPGPAVDSAARVSVVLREITGEGRPPRRKAPTPRLFQYHVLHGPFVPLSVVPHRPSTHD
jgi:hypothetical protein